MVVEVGALAIAVASGVAGSAAWDLVKSEFLGTPLADLFRAVEADPASNAARKILVDALTDALRENAALAEELAALKLLTPWQVRLSPEGAAEAELLNPYIRFTRMVGRDPLMVDLDAWANSDKPVAIRLLTGRAGAGKTRVALELMGRLEGPHGNRWRCGLLSAANIPSFSELGPQGNVLVVVEHAGMACKQLREWFERLGDCPREIGRLRILLLEREAESSRWWRTLTDVADGQHRRGHLRESLDPDGPIPLHPLGEDDQREVLREMLCKASEHLRLGPPPGLPARGENEWFDKQLALRQWGDPLYLMMAALVALTQKTPDVVCVLSLDRAELAHEIAAHEMERLSSSASTAERPTIALLCMAAHSTLCGGIPDCDRIRATKDELDSLGRTWQGGPGELADLLADALPGPNGGIGSVEPAIVGEAFVLRSLRHLSRSEQHDAILRAARRAPVESVSSVVGAVLDLGASDAPEPMQWLDVLIQEGASRTPALLPMIASALPEETSHLRECAVTVAQLLLERVVPGSDWADETEYRVARARVLDHVAAKLGQAGRHEEALSRAQEATRIREQISLADPSAFRSDLATSLGNLASALSRAGRHDEALDKAWQAATLLEQLAESASDKFLPEFAGSLNNMAVMLSSVGRRDEALERAAEATRIYEQLVEVDSGRYLSDLAMSLNNLARALGEMGRHGEAIQHVAKAERIYRELAFLDPDAFLPHHAMALTNLAVTLRQIGEHEEAVARASDAADICERLARSSPGAFLPMLALSLNNLSASLSEAGRHDDAIAKVSEAVQIGGQLADSNDDAHLAELARSLNNLADSLSDVGRYDEAVGNASEAVRIREQLAERSHGATLPDLTRSLAVLARALRGLGHHGEAIEASARSLRLLHGLVQKTPQAFAELAAFVARTHLETAEAAQVAPNTELLIPIMGILQSVGAMRFEELAP